MREQESERRRLPEPGCEITDRSEESRRCDELAYKRRAAPRRPKHEHHGAQRGCRRSLLELPLDWSDKSVHVCQQGFLRHVLAKSAVETGEMLGQCRHTERTSRIAPTTTLISAEAIDG